MTTSISVSGHLARILSGSKRLITHAVKYVAYHAWGQDQEPLCNQIISVCQLYHRPRLWEPLGPTVAASKRTRAFTEPTRSRHFVHRGLVKNSVMSSAILVSDTKTARLSVLTRNTLCHELPNRFSNILRSVTKRIRWSGRGRGDPVSCAASPNV